MRVKHKPWAKAFIDDNDDIFLTDTNFSKVNYFKNNNPIHIEVGIGKGAFIIEMAKQHPNINFIGIEMQASAIVMAGKKLVQEPLDNVKLYNKDLQSLSDYESLKNNIDVIYLNFSDPWPKKRHVKRRLTSEKFLDIYRELLSLEGRIEQKTDSDILFESSLVNYSQNKYVLESVILDLHNADIDNIMTEYEEKFSSKGFKIKKVIARPKE